MATMAACTFSAFASVLETAGAHIAERRCGAIAVQFGEPASEYRALREGCGILDPRLRALLRATGDDRTAFLQGMLSSDIAACHPGEGLPAAILTVQARVVSDLRAFVREDEIWLDFPAQRRAVGMATLEKYIVADDVELSECDDTLLALIEGRTAREVLRVAFGVDPAALPRCSHRAIAIDDAAVRILAATHSGEPGFLLAGPAALAPRVWDQARAAGAVPVGWDALEVARVEAGIPAMDADMDESYLAPEVGLHDAVSTKKGCYIGQEVVERVSARGNVQRRLIGLAFDDDEPVAAGTLLRESGKDAGVVTSAVVSPALGRTVALGYGRRSVWEPGTRVQVGAEEMGRMASVTSLPFVVVPE